MLFTSNKTYYVKKVSYIEKSVKKRRKKGKWEKKKKRRGREGRVTTLCSTKHHMLWGLKAMIYNYVKTNQLNTFKLISFCRFM